jgi:hypothetical protein
MRTCVVCGVEFEPPSRRGRPPKACSDKCRLSRIGRTRKVRTQSKMTECVDCGGPCQRSKPKDGWTPPAESRCRPCFVKSRQNPAAITCSCGGPKYRGAQMCRSCMREAQRTHRIAHPPPNSHARGYTRKHKRLRQAWQTIIELSEVLCARCRCPITTEDLWHLDHADDRSKYLGPSHSRCNLSAAKKQRSKHLFSVKDPA